MVRSHLDALIRDGIPRSVEDYPNRTISECPPSGVAEPRSGHGNVYLRLRGIRIKLQPDRILGRRRRWV